MFRDNIHRKRVGILLLALLIIYGSCYLYTLHGGEFYLKDSYEYLHQAENLRTEGNWYAGETNEEALNLARFSKRPPGYAFFIVAARTLWSSDLAIPLLQSILAILNLWLAYRMLRILKSDGERWLLLPGAIIFPAQVIYSQLIMAEFLFQSILLLGAWHLVRFLCQGRQSHHLAWYHVYLALGVLVKPVLLYFWGLNLLFLLFLVLRKRVPVKLLPLGIIPLLPIVIISFINYQHTGYYHYSSMKGINLLQYNARYTLYQSKGVQEGDSIISSIASRASAQPTFREQQSYIQSSATRHIFQDPVAYAEVHIKGMLNLLLDPGRFDIVNYFNLQSSGGKGMLHYFSKHGYRGIAKMIGDMPFSLVFILMVTLCWNLVLLAGNILFLFHKRVDISVRLFFLILTGYIIFMTGPVGAARYKVAIYPLMLIAFCIGYRYIKWKIMGQRRAAGK